MARHRSLRSELYRDARLVGNVQAAAKGPEAYARRKVYSRTNSFTHSILRSIYLSK